MWYIKMNKDPQTSSLLRYHANIIVDITDAIRADDLSRLNHLHEHLTHDMVMNYQLRKAYLDLLDVVR